MNPMVLAKRQDLCIGPVICEQTANSCQTCEAGYYCTSDGGCCEDGQVCSGFRPCVNAGAPAASGTQICPTDAPLCTQSAGTPICSGSIEDWITISSALAGTATITTGLSSSTPPPPPTSTTASSSYVAPPTSNVYTTKTTPTPSTTISYSPPDYSSATTTATPPPVATGSGARNQLELSVIAGFVLLTVFFL